MTMTPPPMALGLFTCDQVIVDLDSRCPSPINMFTAISVDGFPSEPRDFSVFAVLSGGHGQGTMQVEVIRLDTGDLVYSEESGIQFVDRRRIVNAHIRIKKACFPVPGTYGVDLLVDGVPVAQRKLNVYSIGRNDI